jgi:hypothetical protein
MAASAPSDLQPLIAQVAADVPGAGERLVAALALLLRPLLRAAAPGRHGRVVHDWIASLSSTQGADADSRKDVTPAIALALPVLLAAADAVRQAIADSAPSAIPSDNARLPQTALELAAQGATEQLAHADRVIEDVGHTDPMAAHVARLRFYAGLDLQQIALVLDLSSTSVRRAWNRVRSGMRQ